MLQYSNDQMELPCQTLICCLQDDFIADRTSDNSAHHILPRLKPSISALNCRSIRETTFLHFERLQKLDADHVLFFQHQEIFTEMFFCLLLPWLSLV